MQLEQIITFLDLVETRSFGLTAERLGLTQSTVSARISALERALGSTLFYRGRSGTSPTPAGRRFEEHARSITASWGLARQALGTINRFDGSLRIASQVSLTDTLLFDWMDQIRIELPKVALHVKSDYSPQMIDDLAFGNLDIGVLYAPRYLPEIQFEQIMIQQFCSCRARQNGWPKSSRPPMCARDIHRPLKRLTPKCSPNFRGRAFPSVSTCLP